MNKALKKVLCLAVFAPLLMFSKPAGAQLQADFVERELEKYPMWPLTAQCTATDVNVRTEPNTNCAVITMLQNGDVFYVNNVVRGNDYVWLQGRTADGAEGYMVGNYLDAAYNATSRAERFRALVDSAWITNVKKFAAASGQDYSDRIINLSEEKFHYAEQMIKIGPHELHGSYDGGGSLDATAVVLHGPGFAVLGHEVGEQLTNAQLQEINRDMLDIGWNEIYFDASSNTYRWYLEEKVDGAMRPVKEIAFTVKNNVITEIVYHYVVID